MTILTIFSVGLFIGTLILMYLNWRIMQITESLLVETVRIRKDTQVMKMDTKRVADSFEVTLP